MTKCHLCGRKAGSFKKINTAELFECKKCQLVTIIDKHNHKKKLKQLYNLKNYLNEAKRLKKVLLKHSTIVCHFNNKLKNRKGKTSKVLKILDIGGGYGLFDSLLVKRLVGENLGNNKKTSSSRSNNFTSKNSVLEKINNNIKLEVIEPSQKPYFLKKIPHKLHKTSFENFLKTSRKKYDLVIMMDVLEHFKNPSENLKKTLKILTKDGQLVIQTPNYQSLMAKICKNWAWWMPEDHKYIFSVNSLKKIIKKDYKIEHFQTYEDFYSFKKNFDGNFTEINSHVVRKLIKAVVYGLFFPLYLLLRPIIWRLGYGGLIFLVAKKRYNNS